MRRLLDHFRGLDQREQMLRVVQPGLTGLIDGTISTLAPVFAAAFAAGTHAALVVGLAASFGAAISMGLSEGLSDDGELTGRGQALHRGLICGLATFAGGMFHVLPFLINDLSSALRLAYPIVAIELFGIAFVRKRFQFVSMRTSLLQVTLGGTVVACAGVALGHV